MSDRVAELERDLAMARTAYAELSCAFDRLKNMHTREALLANAMKSERDDAVRMVIAEHDWRRGHAGPCPTESACPTCRWIDKHGGI